MASPDRLTVFNLDAADGDWIKRGSWDIPAHSLPDLNEWLFEQGVTAEHFRTLDVYRSNVDRLPWLRDL